MYSWVKSLFVLLVLFVFIGNIGIGVFTHTCKEEGKFTSFYLNLNEHCADEAVVELSPCCRKACAEAPVSAISEDCCSDDLKLFKIKLDYNSPIKAIQFDLQALPIEVQRERIQTIFYRTYSLVARTHPPPIRNGKVILIQHQVFRI